MLMTVSSAAFAQTNLPQTRTDTTPTGTPATSTPMKTAVGGTQASAANLQQQLTNNLRQSGFTDVKVMPGSSIVQAKDKSDNPVIMFLSPHSITEFINVNSNRQNARTGADGTGN